MKPYSFLTILLVSYTTVLNSQTQLGSDILNNAQASFGSSVSLSTDGNRIAIGARGNNNTAGFVEVYEFNTELCEWEQLGQTLTDNNAGAQFGADVSLSADGNRLAVGAPFHPFGNIHGPGRVTIYEFIGSNWAPIGNPLNGSNNGARYGHAVALSEDGSNIAIGAFRTQTADGITGQVEIRQSVTGELVGDAINGIAGNTEFGYAVSLSSQGNRVAIGARNDNKTGYVQIFEWNTVSWNLLGNQTLHGAHSDDWFGIHLSLSGDGNRVAIASNAYDNVVNPPSDNGRVATFSWNGSNWVNLGPPIIGAPGETIGTDVALSSDGNSLVIGGANVSTENGQNSGRVRKYNYMTNSSNWVQEGLDIIGESQGSFLGNAVSIDNHGNRFAIGIPVANNSTQRVQVFDCTNFICAIPVVCCEGENLIENGDFEDGNLNFVSTYNFVQGDNLLPGDYTVIADEDATQICAEWDVEDYDSCNGQVDNQMVLIVNGQTQQYFNSDQVIWQTASPINVELNAEYTFCFKVKSLASCCLEVTPKLKIEIRQTNGFWTPITDWLPIDPTQANNDLCDWVNIAETINTSSNTIAIRILIDELGNGDGNDLAIDNVALTKC